MSLRDELYGRKAAAPKPTPPPAAHAFGTNAALPPTPPPPPPPPPAPAPTPQPAVPPAKSPSSRPAALPQRLQFFWRSGTHASYPYHHVSLIEFNGRDQIVLHTCCASLDSITITGRNLSRLAADLTAQKTAEIHESDNISFAGENTPVIQELQLARRQRR